VACKTEKGAEDFIDETLKEADDGDDVMSLHTIKQASPFTAMFANAIKSLSIDDKNSSSAVANAHYSPASSFSVQEIIHLFPLWSCLLQSNVVRLGSDYANSTKDLQFVVYRMQPLNHISKD